MHRLALALILTIALVSVSAGSDWLQYRGTDNASTSAEKRLPTSIDEETIAWKTTLPGRGPSSPIVVKGRVVVTCSTGVREDRLHVLSIDAASGKVQWQRQVWATGHTTCHPFGSVADNTPASDGHRIYAMYSSNDLVCYDLDGNLQWFRGLSLEHPSSRNDVGMSSSPLIVGDTVVAQVENQGESFAMGFDAATGETRWKIDRERDAMWCSPLVLRGKEPAEDLVLIQSRSRLTAHEPKTGKQLWDYEAPCHTIASATTDNGTVYLPASGLHALKHDPAAAEPQLLWHEMRLRSGNASPIVHEDRVYVLKPPGIVVCGDTKSGDVLWQLRLKGPFWATAIAADGHLYTVNHSGLVQIVRLGEEGTLVGTSQLDPGMLASPAVSDGAIYFRSDRHLWKVVRAQK